MLEKKRVRREADRSFKDAKDDAFGDYDESTLMGGEDSFQARYGLGSKRFVSLYSSNHSQNCSARCGEAPFRRKTFIRFRREANSCP